MVVAKKNWVKFARTSETRGVGMKIIKKDDLLDEGDEVYDVCLEQALYRVVDGKIEEVNDE